MEAARKSAKEILLSVDGEQVDLVAEMLSETEQNETLHRIFEAHKLGFLAVTTEGLWTITEKGSKYVASKS